MVKLTNKQHEQQQDNRIRKLENDLKQEKSTRISLTRQVNAIEKQLKNLRKKI